MKRSFEYMNDSDRQRLAMLENKAAELERRLGQAAPEHDVPGFPARDFGTIEFPALAQPPQDGGAAYGRARNGRRGAGYRLAGYPEASAPGPAPAPAHLRAGTARRGPAAAYPEAGAADREAMSAHREAGTGYQEAVNGYWPAAPAGYRGGEPGGYPDAGPGGYPDMPAVGYPDPGVAGYRDGAAGGPDERTEVLINRGRRNARRRGLSRWLAHWRAIATGAAAISVGVFLLAVVLPGGSAGWPASVARVRAEIGVACQNPNVVSEPSQVNFACAKDTRQILWVFSLLTSGNNPNFTDRSNGRKGLEPISPAQGGDVAWSLNLHHPYDPASPTDSLAVAARAINDIIGGATVTSAKGTPVVQPGLESNAANCARYTGSPALVTRQGFPALCALPVSSPEGQAALVSDVFRQWMVGTPSQVATEAGVLFGNADNPGDPRVQSILNSLPTSGR